jgi:hypothetical protein
MLRLCKSTRAKSKALWMLDFENAQPTLSLDGADVLFYGREGPIRVTCVINKEALRVAYGLGDDPLAFVPAFRDHFRDIQLRATKKYVLGLGKQTNVIELGVEDLVMNV